MTKIKELNNKIIEMKNEYLCPPSFLHFYKNPPVIVRGEMQYLFDDTSKKYLDFFAGVSVMNCGHCNEEILNATITQMKTLQHTSIIYLTKPIVELAQKLSQLLPGNIKRSFFCCTGSEANETALLMAKLYNGKNEFIAFKNGLHGRTYLTMSATEIPMWRCDPYLSNNFHFVDNSDSEKCLSSIKHLISTRGEDKICALIAEPIQGNGGIIIPENDFFIKLKALLEKHNILLIIDEIQTGFARTGKMFAIENYNIVPDILTVAKALGNGMPISAACTTDNIAMKFNKPSASTLGGNPVSCATALAVLKYIEENNLCVNAKYLGNLLMNGLKELKEKHNIISDVRGMGLMIGVELKLNGKPAPNETDLILENLKDNGVILGKNGLYRNVLAFQPPLVINEDDVKKVLYELDLALTTL